jgi:hypothetical protein
MFPDKELQFLIYNTPQENVKVDVSILEITTQHGAMTDKTQNIETKFYNLDAIIAAGYRVNSKRATDFRIWATKILKEFISKGFVLDDERLKQGKTAFGKDYFRELNAKLKICLSLFIVFNVFSTSAQDAESPLKNYVNFLNTQNSSAKDYVIRLFEKYDIVVLCERYHQEMTQYDLIYDIVSDKKFTENGGQIMMEVGVANIYEQLNHFLQNDTLTSEEVEKNLLQIIRNNDFYPLWEMTNYPVFLKKLHYLNKTLSEQQKIIVHPVDISFSWKNIASKREYKAVMDTVDSGLRDEIMGKQMQKIISENSNKKFLIIMNHYHSWFIPEEYGAAWWVKNSFPEKTINILINNVLRNNLTDDGKWDAAFKLIGKADLGFDLANTPFGETNFDRYLIKWHDTEIDTVMKTPDKMQDFFHGYIFYQPIEKHVLSYGYPNSISKDFQKEMNRRSKIAWGNLVAFFGKYKIRNYYNKVREKQYDNIDKLMEQRNKWIIEK